MQLIRINMRHMDISSAPTLPSKLAAASVQPCPTQRMPDAPTPRWDSTQLLGAAREVEIVHGDQVYRLRHTALGKLILTK